MQSENRSVCTRCTQRKRMLPQSTIQHHYIKPPDTQIRKTKQIQERHSQRLTDSGRMSEQQQKKRQRNKYCTSVCDTHRVFSLYRSVGSLFDDACYRYGATNKIICFIYIPHSLRPYSSYNIIIMAMPLLFAYLLYNNSFIYLY